MDLDQDIPTVEEKPDFTEDFVTIELSSLFMNAPANWQDFLPYYRFKPADEWIQWRSDYDYSYPVTPGEEFCFWSCDEGWICRCDVLYPFGGDRPRGPSGTPAPPHHPPAEPESKHGGLKMTAALEVAW